MKHMEELMRCVEDGYDAYVCFVIQMKGVTPAGANDRTHPAFGETLRRAAEAGVKVLAYDCLVKPDRVEDRQRN